MFDSNLIIINSEKIDFVKLIMIKNELYIKLFMFRYDIVADSRDK